MVTLSDEQNGAVKKIVDWYRNEPAKQEFYLAGYAGVGKSTVVEHAIAALEDQAGISKIYTAAYTGKAAHVLHTKGVRGASTIHSLIYVPTGNDESGQIQFAVDEASPANRAELIVIDEVSMVPEKMASDLRSFGKKILVIGDPGQLPPVQGAGAFTKREPDVLLQTIHRQAADSPILYLATLARQGKPLPVGFERDDVRVLKLNKDTAHLVQNEHTQPLCGLNNVRWQLTRQIRKARQRAGKHPLTGEPIMCTRNDWDKGLFNGLVGTVKGIDPHAPRGEYRLDFEDDFDGYQHHGLQVDPYLFQSNYAEKKLESLEHNQYGALNEFDWAYILTVHKAQGSSWPHVTLVDDSQWFRENASKWLYTGLTRAEAGLTVLVR